MITLQDLITKHPEIFIHKTGVPVFRAYVGYERGGQFEISEGWANIIDAWCNGIKQEISYAQQRYKHENDLGWDSVLEPSYPQPLIVKTKFGSLEIQGTEWSNPDVLWISDKLNQSIRGITAMAKKMSEVTCETTGKPGVLRVSGSGYYRTVCEDFFDEYKDPEKFIAAKNK